MKRNGMTRTAKKLIDRFDAAAGQWYWHRSASIEAARVEYEAARAALEQYVTRLQRARSRSVG